MNDNYLWDKSGEPDEEIQHLESLLSEFRYQPRPLVLPEATPKRMIFSQVTLATMRYAAIAAVVLLALGLGLWYGVRSTEQQQPIAALPQTASPIPSVTSHQEAAVGKPQPETPSPQNVKHTATPQTRAVKTPRRTVNRQTELEGERAKEKVLYALQITSKQLDTITKKIQTDTN